MKISNIFSLVTEQIIGIEQKKIPMPNNPTIIYSNVIFFLC